MKQIIQRCLGKVGLELRRTGSADGELDPYEVMKTLTKRQRPVIFDVGANVGGTVAQFRDICPDAMIYCFEPDSKCYELLGNARKSDTNTSLHKSALSNTKGKATFKANQCADTNSLLAVDERAGEYWGNGVINPDCEIEIETTTVDDFCSEQQIPFIDILKLDVQGAEYSVLEGARRMLENKAVSLIFTEIILVPTYQGQKMFHDYLEFLDSLGYVLLDMYNPVRRDWRRLQMDCIFRSAVESRM